MPAAALIALGAFNRKEICMPRPVANIDASAFVALVQEPVEYKKKLKAYSDRRDAAEKAEQSAALTMSQLADANIALRERERSTADAESEMRSRELECDKAQEDLELRAAKLADKDVELTERQRVLDEHEGIFEERRQKAVTELQSA